jgi:NTE family protein
MRFALVLSGGGTSGVAWQIGLLKGLQESGIDLTHPDVFVGTSAGAIVAAQLATGRTLDDLYAEQLLPADDQRPRNIESLMRVMGELRRRWQSPPTAGMSQEMLAELGVEALRADTESEASRLATIASYLAGETRWPERRLLITAVDTGDGSFAIWDKDSGATLTEAVASSCAAPMVAPPITIKGRRYMDAGPRSGTSAQLAAGCELVVILAVARPGPLGTLDDEIDELRGSGSRIELVLPDEHSLAAIFPNPLDLANRPRSASAGHAQARALDAAGRQRLAVATL